jgi:hypothetical protein
MTCCTSGIDGTRLTKTKGQREPCPHATGYIQGYKLPCYSLAYPSHSKSPKVSPSCNLTTTRALPILHSLHWLGLVGALLGCGWHLNLKLMHLLHKGINLLLPIIKLKVLHLNSVIPVHDGMGPRVHLLSGEL